MNVLELKFTNMVSKMKGKMQYLTGALMLLSAIYAANPAVFAVNTAKTGEQVIAGVLTVVFLITNVLGILFVIIGFVKLVISHAQEDAPGQQKAAMFIATGLALILLRIVLGLIPFADWLDPSKS